MKIISLAKHITKTILGREKIKFEKVNNEINEIQNEKIFYSDLDETNLLTKNKDMYKYLIAIDGVGCSGSSALGDFLGEFSTCTSLGGVDPRENPERGIENSYEIDFLRDPGSLLDLERICYTNVGRLRDNAIHEFIDVCKKYYECSIPIFDEYFYNISKKFVKEITSFAYLDSPEHVSYYPKKINLTEYRKFAKELMLSILKNIPSKEFLVCDNLASIGRPDNNIIKDYLGDCKILMNYSDPRDIYARARLQDNCDWVPVDPELFVQNWIENVIPDITIKEHNTLITNFDDFCNDYNVQAKKIIDFLGLDEKDHIEKFKYFNPKISINNTGVWKKLENQKPIDYIFQNLKEFCYDLDSKKRYS